MMELKPFNLLDFNKKRVVLRGPTLTSSGYGVHARQVLRWLLGRSDFDVRVMLLPWGDTPWLLNGDTDELVAEAVKRSSPHFGQPDISFQLQLPNEWDPNAARINIGMTAGVETDICNPQWIDACNKMSLVIVPSEHAKRSLTSTGGVTTKVVVVPEAYTPACEAEGPGLNIDFETEFNFLMVGQITGNNPENDRKNMFYAIKWFCETFKDDPSTGLVIKTNSGRNTKIDRNVVTGLMSQLLREVRPLLYPKVYIVHGHMNDDEVASLYRHRKIKALLAPTRGEGFGLPMIEAAACGLPIIATGWSGHMDYLSLGRFTRLDYKLDPVHPSRVDNQIFVQGAKWANVLEDDFKKQLRRFRSSPHVPLEWAGELRKKIQEKYSFSAVSRLYDAAIEGVV